jgi:hypothetical protein
MSLRDGAVGRGSAQAPPDAGGSRAASPERMNPQMNRCSVSVWFMRCRQATREAPAQAELRRTAPGLMTLNRNRVLTLGNVQLNGSP